jgi:hypothetical protein
MSLDHNTLIKKVKKISLFTSRNIDSFFIGDYKSIFKGDGIEFNDVREYQYGDNFKDIDWNITARFNKPYIKRFVEERERIVYFVVDVSSSLNTFIGQKNKFEIMAEILAILSYSALAAGDKVSVILFSDGIEKIIKPTKGLRSFYNIILQFLVYENKIGLKTNINNVLRLLNNIVRKKSLVFLISDFFDDNYEKNLLKLSLKNEIIPIIVNNDREFLPIDNCIIQFYDIETERFFRLNLNKKEHKNHLQNLIEERRKTIQNLIKRKIFPLVISEEKDIHLQLLEYFRRRKHQK